MNSYPAQTFEFDRYNTVYPEIATPWDILADSRQNFVMSHVAVAHSIEVPPVANEPAVHRPLGQLALRGVETSAADLADGTQQVVQLLLGAQPVQHARSFYSLAA